MANLDLIKRLNKLYNKNSSIASDTKYFSLNESLDPDNIKKAIADSILNLGLEFKNHFDYGLPADVVLLYIDVCNFSTRFSNLNGDEIGKYFDEYYDIVIPLIYKYGGEIDKIMGDGIICVFGPPFQNLPLCSNIVKADACSKEILVATNKSPKFSSKIAMHCGTINYFKNKTSFYKEFTLIGKPLTELFRLESISENKRINYFENTDIRKYYNSFYGKSINWKSFVKPINNLKGVSYEKFYYLKHI